MITKKRSKPFINLIIFIYRGREASVLFHQLRGSVERVAGSAFRVQDGDRGQGRCAGYDYQPGRQLFAVRGLHDEKPAAVSSEHKGRPVFPSQQGNAVFTAEIGRAHGH